MPAALKRNEYYWQDDRLRCRVNQRSSVHRRWKLVSNESDLVLTIEDRTKIRKMVRGPAATTARVSHAIVRENRLSAEAHSVDIGQSIPAPLIDKISSVVRSAVSDVVCNFYQLSNEERRTGALTIGINRQQIFQFGDWEATVILQGFSAQKKEPLTGADIGIVVDLRNGQSQVSKSVWVQAKEAEQLPDHPLLLDRLSEQMASMLNRTSDAYGLIYTPNGVHVFQGRETDQYFALDTLIADIAGCRRGDRRPEFLADTIERDYLVEVSLEHAGNKQRPTASLFS